MAELEKVVLPKERFEDFVRCKINEIEEYAPEVADEEDDVKTVCWADGFIDALNWVLDLIEDESEAR